MGLEGNLKDFDLSDILQLINMGKKTGALDVQGEADSGMIYFNEGTAIHAKVADATGDNAVNRILRWRTGAFVFRSGETTTLRTIQTPIQHLVLDAARQIDEWHDIQKVITSLDLILAIEEKPSAGTEDIKLQPVEWRALSLVDGSRSIKQIVKDGHAAEFEICKVLYGLLTAGLLKVVPVTAPAPKPAAAAAPAPKPATAAVPAPPPKPEPEKKGLGGLFGKKK